MQRLHVNLQVADLGAATRFYRELFAAEPTVEKDDYAKWMLDDPRVNFSLVARGAAPGFGHLGIQAETTEELAELRRRIGRLQETGTDARVDDEGETVCCYHHSDKTWVTDGQGIAWEAFHTAGESDSFDDGYEAAPGARSKAASRAHGTTDEAACCAPDCCADDAPVHPAEAKAAAPCCA